MGKAKRVGIYIRVSTSGQTTENQRRELGRVAEQRGWQVAGVYEDAGISGSKGRAKRPAFDQLCRDAAQGKLDLVAAWSIDRLSRSLHDLVTFLADLEAQGVGIYLHQQAIDSSTPAGNAMVSMCGVFAEFERSLIVERVHAGLARARAQGKKLGRPTSVTSSTEAQIRALHGKGVGMGKIAKQLQCGVSTVQRVLAA